jgi:hypothetical protein
MLEEDLMARKWTPETALKFKPAKARPYWCDIFRAVQRGEDWRDAYGGEFLGGFATYESEAVTELVRQGRIREGEPLITYRRSTTGRAPVGAWILPPDWTLPEAA